MSQAAPASRSTQPSTNPPSPTNGRKGKRSGRRLRAIIISLAAISLLGIVVLIIAIQGSVEGEEFAPSHFQAREFSFYEIPGLQLQVTPIKRKTTMIDLATFLRSRGWVRTPAGAPAEGDWHLTRIQRGFTDYKGDAEILLHAFSDDAMGNGNVWKDWSKNHPKAAQWMWPRIQTLAERELYVVIPHLLELAQRVSDPTELAKQGDALILEHYVDLIRDTREANNDVLADAFLEEAEQDFPNDPGLAKLQASSK